VTGVRKRGDATLATVDDQWHLGSDTKAMTAAIAARLAERHLISLDDTLSELFPNEEATMDPGYKQVSLRLLLSHRSGMGDVADYPDVAAALAERTDPVEVIRALWTHGVLSLPPVNAPNSTFVYSNSGYVVAGAALERVTGKPWETLIAEEVFGPLGMASCGFGAPGGAAARPVDQPWGHDGMTAFPPGPDADNPAALGPAGTVHCSLRDWSKFVAVFLGAEPDYLSNSSRMTLTTPQPGADYALGWLAADRTWANGAAFNHTGSNTLWFANVWVAPNRDRAFMTVTTRGDVAAAFPASDAAVAALIEAYVQ
jgi:CubicO group peptidase (beta-lactamase class C family)